MDWLSFSWGAVASLVLVSIVWLAGIKRQDPSDPEDVGDSLDPPSLRDIIETADARYRALYTRYSELKAAVDKIRSAQRAYMRERSNRAYIQQHSTNIVLGRALFDGRTQEVDTDLISTSPAGGR